MRVFIFGDDEFFELRAFLLMTEWDNKVLS